MVVLVGFLIEGQLIFNRSLLFTRNATWETALFLTGEWTREGGSFEKLAVVHHPWITGLFEDGEESRGHFLQCGRVR
jgi:hypothetical protein